MSFERLFDGVDRLPSHRFTTSTTNLPPAFILYAASIPKKVQLQACLDFFVTYQVVKRRPLRIGVISCWLGRFSRSPMEVLGGRTRDKNSVVKDVARTPRETGHIANYGSPKLSVPLPSNRPFCR